MSGFNGNVARGFFSSLFDLNFRSFITLKFLKVIYAVLLVAILLGGLIAFIGFIARGGAWIVVGIIGAPIVTLLYLVITRIYLEAIAMFFRIGENVSILAAAAAGRPGAPAPEPWGPSAYPPGGGYGPGYGAPAAPTPPVAPGGAYGPGFVPPPPPPPPGEAPDRGPAD